MGSERQQDRRGAGAAWLTVAIAGGAFAWLAAVTWLAAGTWLGVPFPGFIVEATGNTGAVLLADWPGQAAGVGTYWQAESVDGRPLGSGAAVYAEAAARPVGTALRWGFVTPTGEHVVRVVPTAAFQGWDLTRLFTLWWASGLAHVALGALVLVLRPRDGAAWAHWWLCLALGVFLVTNFDVASTFWLPGWVSYGAAAAVAPAMAALALAFPRRRLGPRGRKAVVGGFAALALALVGAFAWGDARLTALAGAGVVLLSSAAVLAAIGLWLLDALAPGRAPAERAQARVATLGLAVAFGPAILATALAPLVGAGAPGLDLAHVAFAAFPLAIAYAIARHGAFEVPSALPALRDWLDRALYQELKAALTALEAFGRRPAVATGDVATEVLALATRLAAPAWAAVWLDGVRLAARGAAPAEPPAEVPGGLRVRLPIGEEAEAWLVLGPRAAGPAYRVGDRAAIEVLAAHAGTALGRAHLAEERVALRIREGVARALAEERDGMLKQVLHDLKTEVFNVGLAAEHGQRVGEADEALVRIERSAERMSDFLREKARQVVDGRQACLTAFGPVVEGVREALAPALATRGQSLAVAIDEPGAAVPLTGVELGQILLNLLENASKFSPPGGAIRLLARREGERLVIAVVDQGPGLPAGWAIGRRADPSMPGSGLGLRNVEQLAQAAGGTLAWRNGPAGGAVFEVRLPAAAREPA